MMNKKVILLTGASSGIGFDTARMLARQGHIVYGAARRVERMEELKTDGVIPLALDVTDALSCHQAVEQIMTEQSRIDVLINNAGYGSYGAIEDVSLEEAKRQFEVNVFGLARLTKEVLPYMRQQKSGRIINVSSIGGRLTTYFGGWYHATKYAVEGLSDALRMETKEFGITVSLIEPGGIKTEWGGIAADHLEQSSRGGAYEQAAAKVAASIRKQYEGTMMADPAVVSRAISQAVNQNHPKTRYVIGFGAKPLVFLHAILPARIFDWIIMRAVA